MKPVRAAARVLAAALCTCLLMVPAGCGKGEQPQNRTGHLGGKTLAETIDDNRPHLLSIPGVVRVEGGDCGVDSCIKVFVEKKSAILTSQIPLMLETWQVDVVEISK